MCIIDKYLHSSFQYDIELIPIVSLTEHPIPMWHSLISQFLTYVIQVLFFDLSLFEKWYFFNQWNKDM